MAECLRQIVPDKYPEAKSHHVLANGGLLRETNRGKYSTTSSFNKGSPSSEVRVIRGKYSTTSSLNKGSPSAEVHVSRGKYSTTSSLNKGSPSSEVQVSKMPKLHTAKTDYAKITLS